MHNAKSNPQPESNSLAELKWSDGREPFVPEGITKLIPYQPGKPIEETKREFGVKEVIKLASNENPIGPSPKAIAAVKESLRQAHLYPDASHYELKKALALKLGCAVEEVGISNGSNEAIDLLIRAFVEPGKVLVTHRAAFQAYALCAQLQGARCVQVPLSDDLKPRIQDLIAALDSNVRMVMIANPNNPTGAFFDATEIEALAKATAEKKVLLVLDYAYWEYVTDKAVPDPMQVFKKYPHVIVLRTFSKIFGLAGFRVGYTIARKNIISVFERARQPFNVNAFGLVAAKAALSDVTHLEHSKSLNQSSRHELVNALSNFPVVVYPSQGNFLLVDFRRPSSELHTEFLKRGVILRPLVNYGFTTHFRITCGLPEENQKLLEALREVFL